jgi:hypothetical protein
MTLQPSSAYELSLFDFVNIEPSVDWFNMSECYMRCEISKLTQNSDIRLRRGLGCRPTRGWKPHIGSLKLDQNRGYHGYTLEGQY